VSSTQSTAATGLQRADAAPVTVPTQGLFPLLQQYLVEQQELTAVERFSQLHDQDELPSRAKYYRSLMPASLPGPGQQYGFEVDLDRCSGCKACVTACHSLNGLEPDETWRVVGLLHGGSATHPIQKTVTTACHHCLEPACMHGCPVGAYGGSPLKHRPSDYLTSGRFFSSIEMHEGEDMFNSVTSFLGDDVLMYASDYPHAECHFPHSVEHVLGWARLKPETRQKLLWDNAARFYKQT
jgi:ferredoxin